MDVKNTHSVTKTEISVFGRQALDAERRRSPSLADKVLKGKKIKSLYLFFTFQNDARKFVSDRTKSEVAFLACWKSVKFVQPHGIHKIKPSNFVPLHLRKVSKEIWVS